MMHVKLQVTGQQLKRLTTPFLVRDSKNYVLLDFKFSDDWAGCEKTAIFNGKYEKELVDDSVIVPASCLTSPEFTVSVYGEYFDMLITTNAVTVQLGASGYVPDADVPSDVLIEELQKRVEELEASIKPEQEKAVTIAENGTVDVLPDENKTLSKVTVNVDVADTGKELENLIDESRVLDSTDGTVTDKIKKLIEKSADENLWFQHASIARGWNDERYFKGYKGVRLPRIDVSQYTSMGYFCGNAKNLESIDFYLNSEKATSWDYAFLGTTSLKRMKGINTSSAEIFGETFNGSGIEEITEPLDFSNVTYTNKCFFANFLKEIRFIEKTIKVSTAFTSAVLSEESIQSIIDGLAKVETQQIITFHGDVIERICSNEELVDLLLVIEEKNWNLG